MDTSISAVKKARLSRNFPKILRDFLGFLIFVFGTQWAMGYLKNNNDDQQSVVSKKDSNIASFPQSSRPQRMTRDLVQESVAILECGEICDIDTEPTAPGSFVPVLRKQLSCQNVMFRMLSSCPAIDWPPPNDPPDELLDAYTMGGKVELFKYQDKALAQRYSGKKAKTPTWTEDYIKTLMVDAKSNKRITVYGPNMDKYLIGVFKQYSADIQGKVGIVIGTEKPWVEAHLLNQGAELVVTLEYGRIVSEHPQLVPVVASELAALFLAKGGVEADFIVTISSLEHSGLGRYGDPLNPAGDLEAMAQAFCLLKPGGLMLLGVPSTGGDHTQDQLFWNAHRVYGRKRMQHMAANFDFLQVHESPEWSAVVFAMRKPRDEGL